MGGVVRTVRRAVGGALRTITGAPSKKQIAAQQAAAQRQAEAQAAAQAKAQAEAAAKAKAEAEAKAKQEAAVKAQQQVDVIDAPGDPNNPANVVYSGEGGEMGGGKKKRRKKGGTILTGSKGVIGDAPTEKATLLGG